LRIVTKAFLRYLYSVDGQKLFVQQGYVPVLPGVEGPKGLPPEKLESLAEKLGISLSRVYSVATFYKAFSLKPVGKHQIHVCMGTACHVRGSRQVLDSISRELGLQPGDTSADLRFSLATVNCLGSCALGPLVTVDEDYLGHATSQGMKKIISQMKKEE
jgi:NADH-quinone oxidoreductase subunit E